MIRLTSLCASAVALLVAAMSAWAVTTIDRPGSVSDGFLCESERAVGFDPKPGCQHYNEVPVHVLAVIEDRVIVVLNGQARFALAARVLISCWGTLISVASFVLRKFPPGMKSCAK